MQVERNLNSHPSSGTRENFYSQEINVKKNQRTKEKTQYKFHRPVRKLNKKL